MHDPAPLTDEQLAAWQALCDSATPGEWFWENLDALQGVSSDEEEDRYLPDNLSSRCGGQRVVIEADYTCDETEDDFTFLRLRKPDADLIAAARTALPLLLAEVRRLREAVAAEREACAREAKATRTVLGRVIAERIRAREQQ